jgi:malonyl-CoA O-methyltransferase
MASILDGKELIARRFGLRAADYDAVTPVQSLMRQALMEQVSIGQTGPIHRILELGCGTGQLTRELAANYPHARITAFDIAAGMVSHAKARQSEVEFVVCDAESEIQHLEESGERFDLVISNATVQWFEDPVAAMCRCQSILNPGGTLAWTTFGDRNFPELRASLEAAYRHLNRCPQAHVQAHPSLQCWTAKFPDARISELFHVLEFSNPRDFLKSVRRAGASSSPSQGMRLPKDVWLETREHYAREFRATDGAGIRATYHGIACALSR